jgi:hypothetical protein
VLTPARTEIHGRRGALAPLAPQPSQDGGEGRVAVLAHQQPDGDDGLATTAGQFEPALGPVAEMVRCKEGRRVHGRTIE